MKCRDLLLPGMLLILLAVPALTGCSSTPERPPAPTQTASVSISPIVPEEVQNNLSACFGELEGVYPILNPSYSPYPDLAQSDVILWWGDPGRYQALQVGDHVIFKVMDAEVRVLVHPQNPLTVISPSQLRDVFAGTSEVWTDLTEHPPESKIEVWVLPGEHPAQVLFERAVMQGVPIGNSARVAPDLSSLREAVQKNQAAIGLSFMDVSPEGRFLAVQPPVDALRQPVLLIYPEPAPDYAADLANCLIPDLD